jgi:hypothetical protein
LSCSSKEASRSDVPARYLTNLQSDRTERLLKLNKEVRAEPYKIRKEDVIFHDVIGGGAYGTVYRGEYSGYDIAVKRMTNAPSAFNEVDKFALTSGSPCVLRLVGFYTDDPHLYIGLELGMGSLESQWDMRRETPIWKRKRWSLDTIAGICYLHSHGILISINEVQASSTRT